MKLTSNVRDWKRHAENLDIVESLDQQIAGVMETVQELISSPYVYVDYTIYGDNLTITINSDFTAIVPIISALCPVLGTPEIPQIHKLRYNGGGGSRCISPQDEWCIHLGWDPGTVALYYRQAAREERYYTITVGRFPVPGHLIEAKETEKQVKQRVEAYALPSHVTKARPRLLGPKELSLCVEEEETE